MIHAVSEVVEEAAQPAVFDLAVEGNEIVERLLAFGKMVVAGIIKKEPVDVAIGGVLAASSFVGAVERIDLRISAVEIGPRDFAQLSVRAHAWPYD